MHPVQHIINQDTGSVFQASYKPAYIVEEKLNIHNILETELNHNNAVLQFELERIGASCSILGKAVSTK